jgi:hypothetical protein
MKVNAQDLQSMIKLLQDGSSVGITIEPNGSSVSFTFTDKGGRDVKVVIFESELNVFATIHFSERLPR